MRIGDWVEIGGDVPVVVIFQAETRLQAVGFDPGPVDGMLDAKTRVALRQYQTDQGLPPTAALDSATQKALGVKWHVIIVQGQEIWEENRNRGVVNRG
jgi:peptidoglycan hydrolase-like protein with peptidoglycan-binding domain